MASAGRCRPGRSAGSRAPEAEEDALWRRDLGCFRAAVKIGDLPMPTRRKDEPWLPRGELSDWGEGTTSETYEPFGPDYHVPEFGLVGGSFAAWDVRPDGEAAAVRERRAAMRGVFASIVRDGGKVDAAVADALTPEPPATLAERERRRAAADAVWPWGTFDGVRDDLRAIAGPLAVARCGPPSPRRSPRCRAGCPTGHPRSTTRRTAPRCCPSSRRRCAARGTSDPPARIRRLPRPPDGWVGSATVRPVGQRANNSAELVMYVQLTEYKVLNRMDNCNQSHLPTGGFESGFRPSLCTKCLGSSAATDGMAKPCR
jgi:hypothetical protein